ncbi:MAG: CoA-binding protein [Candidatus Woesearchaeota archaeon]|jgi:acetyltransferase
MTDEKTLQSLDALYNPKSVALIGASREEGTVGNGLLKNMLGQTMYPSKGKKYEGKIYPVNPKADEILGQKCYHSVSEIQDQVDLAVIMVNSKFVPLVLEECGKKGVKTVIIISAGFSEVKNYDGEKQLVDIAKKHGMRILGPNCLGFLNCTNGLNASFAPSIPSAGNVAFVSQSGAIVDAVIDMVTTYSFGFSSMVSIGNQCDIEITELIEYYAKDPNTEVITGYVESLRDGKKFIEVCKEVSKIKPIVLIKSGKSSKGSQAAASHTGKLAGSHEIFEAACKQAGVLLVDTIEELFDISLVAACAPKLEKNAVAIITNAGGCGVLATDYCEDIGLDMCEFSQETFDILNASPIMNQTYSRHNPLDIIGDAGPARYEIALKCAIKDPNVYGIIVLETLQTTTKPLETAKVILDASKTTKKPIICAIIGGEYSKPGIDFLEQNGMVVFTEAQKAVKAMKFLLNKR